MTWSWWVRSSAGASSAGSEAHRTLTSAVWILIVLTLLAAMAGCGFLGVAIERFAYRPLRRAPRIAPLISALGVSFFLQNSVLLALRGRLPQLRGLRPGGCRGGDQLGPAGNVWIIRIVVIASAFVNDGRPLAARDPHEAREGDAERLRSTVKPPR